MNDLGFYEKKFLLNKTTVLYSNKCTDAHEIL